MKFKHSITVALIFILLILSACSKEAPTAAATDPAKPGASSAPKDAAASTEPITLKFYNSSGTFTNTEFKTFIADPVNKKFPNIKVERIEPPTGTTPEDFFSSGQIPDIIYSSSSSHRKVISLGVLLDLNEYVKKYNFDLTRIKPEMLSYAKELSNKGELLELPFNSNQHILYYNKDIFDKFGVPYPSDTQMTWEQALELGRQLTRTENGVNYIGIDAEGPIGIAKNLALPVIDPKTGKSLLSTPDWVRVFNIAKQNYEIPGYIGKADKYVYGRDEFMKDRNLAMRPTWLANMVGPLEELRQQGLEVNWDIAPVPTFSDQLGKSREAQNHTLSVFTKSTHKDEAFQAIAHILSDDTQRILSRNGRVPAIINPELEKEYGADLPVLKGKKVQNVFAVKPIQEHTSHQFELDINKFVTEAAAGIAKGTDVNTAIRKASESIDKEVERLQKNQ
ncbi:ABC transporter substrate-binding protein [Paenibacillus sp. FSL H7-0331]|uniref:ABC transporter substrate-binding protein n=1 Tax=Paenibacillus sp. FSL H7-0331 TaxID=1920421 RepID=UPI0009701410|nr:ABC transporter substrate-binding protein [Paenibacillus sp. FSL H7-0331]OMF12729.1 ABC transporter substrate-binding protein [Paenibacillus sp. FSL H7-0331]